MTDFRDMEPTRSRIEGKQWILQKSPMGRLRKVEAAIDLWPKSPMLKGCRSFQIQAFEASTGEGPFAKRSELVSSTLQQMLSRLICSILSSNNAEAS